MRAKAPAVSLLASDVDAFLDPRERRTTTSPRASVRFNRFGRKGMGGADRRCTKIGPAHPVCTRSNTLSKVSLERSFATGATDCCFPCVHL